ncbi:MAG: hypothetical protein QF593_05615, partial [Nitrospinota bacterium]|nr:hypothetical protein [Nitrospinota bacterium]
MAAILRRNRTASLSILNRALPGHATWRGAEDLFWLRWIVARNPVDLEAALRIRPRHGGALCSRGF